MVKKESLKAVGNTLIKRKVGWVDREPKIVRREGEIMGKGAPHL